MTHPSLKEELDRKAFETVEWLFTSISAGKISAAQFSTGIDALFMSVNGLCAEDVTDLMTAADYEARHELPMTRYTLLKGNKVVVITWVIGNELIEIVGYTDGIETTRQDKIYDTPKEARDSSIKAGAKLVSMGYIQL